MPNEILVRMEARPAVLRCPEYIAKEDDTREFVGIHEESVFVFTAAFRELARCEHPDGTVTSESWDHIKFLDSTERFREVCWVEH